VKIGYLILVGHLAFPPPQTPLDSPLKPHPSIDDFLEPPMHTTNDGWENIIANPSFGIVHWPDIPFPPLPPLHSMPNVGYDASMNHYVQVPRNYKAFPIDPPLDKENTTCKFPKL
jgi:hypothetical protein